jgi:hypothetical protein
MDQHPIDAHDNGKVDLMTRSMSDRRRMAQRVVRGRGGLISKKHPFTNRFPTLGVSENPPARSI